MTDVAIIGAGPAGSSVALRLARAGYQVAIIERSKFPRAKVCGDYLCAGVKSGLKDLGVDAPVLAGAHSIRSIELHGFGAHARLQLPETDAASLPRSVFDDRLLTLARGAGVQLIHGVFLSADESARTIHLRYRDEHGEERELNTHMIIGADGAWSTVAQRCGLVSGKRRPGRWAIGGHLRDQGDSDTLSMYVGTTGYYARNPLTASTANSMLVLPQPARPEDADAIVDKMTYGERRFEPENVERIVAIGPLQYRATRVMRGPVLLTGDAAELLDPFTGQGVSNAIALSVPACAAACALLAGEPQERVAKNYARQWRSIVGPRRALTRLVEAVVRVGFLRARALRSIQRNAYATEAILASVSGVAPARAAFAPRVLTELLAS